MVLDENVVLPPQGACLLARQLDVPTPAGSSVLSSLQTLGV